MLYCTKVRYEESIINVKARFRAKTALASMRSKKIRKN